MSRHRAMRSTTHSPISSACRPPPHSGSCGSGRRAPPLYPRSGILETNTPLPKFVSEIVATYHETSEVTVSGLSAFGIENAIRSFETLETVSGDHDRPCDAEIVGLPHEHEAVSSGWKDKVGILVLNNQHVLIFAQGRHSKFI